MRWRAFAGRYYSVRILRVDFAACVFGALMLLTLPLNWLLAAIFAAVFHELCHIFAILLMGGRVLGIGIGMGGAEIETDVLSPGKELVCTLAGPVGGFLLLVLSQWIPRTALCAQMQSLFNLLPIYPLDGGRALRCAAELAFPAVRRDAICRYVEKAAVLMIVLAALYASFVRRLGIMPLLIAWMLVLKKNTLQRRETRGTIVLPYVKR